MLELSQAASHRNAPVRGDARPDLPRRPCPPADWRFGRCEVRASRRELRVDGQLRQIQPRPFDLLVYLIAHRDRVLSVDELLDVVWGQRIVQPSSLTVAINRIRSVLGDEGGEIIRTHHRVGYRFVAELEDAGLHFMPRQQAGIA